METGIDWQGLLNHLLELAGLYIPKLLLALVTLAVGWWVVNRLVNATRNLAQKRDFDPSLRSFLLNLASISLRVLLLVIVISMIGVKMTAIIAVLGAAGLAIGLALQGSLQNFAGGVLILGFKPFKVGDHIEAQGHSGIVKEIQIIYTFLESFDNELIVLPNGDLANDDIVNYTHEPKRRLNLSFGIHYDDDIDKARNIIMDIVHKDDRVLDDPEPHVKVVSLGDSAVNLAMRVWIETENYWPMYFEYTENVKKAFDENDITIPFPQRDVHLFHENPVPEKV